MKLVRINRQNAFNHISPVKYEITYAAESQMWRKPGLVFKALDLEFSPVFQSHLRYLIPQSAKQFKTNMRI